jgi:hypothetical protein
MGKNKGKRYSEEQIISIEQMMRLPGKCCGTIGSVEN